MSLRSKFAVCLLASIVLSACGKEAAGAQAPVVATFDGQKITVDDLKAEGGPAAPVTEYGALLQRIIDRKVMAKAQDRDALPNPGETQALASRAADTAKANLYAEKISRARGQPTPQEVQAYMQANANSFANRRFIVIEQIELKRTDRPAQLPAPIANLDQVQAALDVKGAQYQRTIAAVDSASSAPKVVEELGAMARDTVFEMGDANNVVFGRVVDVRPIPFTGPMAQSVATNLLRNQGAGQAVKDRLAELKQAAKIKYEAGYEPSK